MMADQLSHVMTDKAPNIPIEVAVGIRLTKPRHNKAAESKGYRL